MLQTLIVVHCVCVVLARSTPQEVYGHTATPEVYSDVTQLSNMAASTPEVSHTALTTSRSIDGGARQARGMIDEYDDHDDLLANEEVAMHQSDSGGKDEGKAVKTDPWEGYYDFLINEGSFKFWAAFQLATAVLLIYSAFAAVYYAKFNPVSSDYDYYDDFFRRRRRSLDATAAAADGSSWFGGLDSQTFQRIIDAITSKKYS